MKFLWNCCFLCTLLCIIKHINITLATVLHQKVALRICKNSDLESFIVGTLSWRWTVIKVELFLRHKQQEEYGKSFNVRCNLLIWSLSVMPITRHRKYSDNLLVWRWSWSWTTRWGWASDNPENTSLRCHQWHSQGSHHGFTKLHFYFMIKLTEQISYFFQQWQFMNI